MLLCEHDECIYQASGHTTLSRVGSHVELIDACMREGTSEEEVADTYG
jgi:hypothetical protein